MQILAVLLALFLMVLSVPVDARGSPSRSSKSKGIIRDNLLPYGYDRLKVPQKPKNEPLIVDIQVHVINIRSIQEKDLSFTVDLFYHQHWHDFRLRPVSAEKIVLDSSWKTKLWMPDSYFKDTIEGEVTNVIFPTLYFNVRNRTRISMISRVSVELHCEMKFKAYPHDTQDCNLDIESFSYSNSTVVLRWMNFTLANEPSTAQYTVAKFTKGTCDSQYQESQEIAYFSCIRSTLFFTRSSGHYFVKRYIPSFLIVVMSFVGFWIPTNAYPARVALVITALLALITQQLQSSAEISASYVVAINVWMVICISFVFFALVEYAFAVSLIDQPTVNETHPFGPIGECFESLSRASCCNISSTTSKINRIDLASRTMFPVAYAICILCYGVYVQSI